MSLTSLQRAFVKHYVDNLASTNKKTQTQIAIDAGYSKNSAYSIASENLKKPEIIRAIEEEIGKQGMPSNEVLFHFAKIARGDVKDSTLGDRLRALENLAKYHNLTNNSTHRIEDWKSDAIDAIKAGEVSYDAFVETFQDESLAQQLFAQAGVPITD